MKHVILSTTYFFTCAAAVFFREGLSLVVLKKREMTAAEFSPARGFLVAIDVVFTPPSAGWHYVRVVVCGFSPPAVADTSHTQRMPP